MARILLIDDGEDFRLLFENMINRLGLKCVCAPTLDEGMAELQQLPYDIVFLDVDLGTHNGLHHLPEIQSTPGNPDVIVVSASRDSQHAESAIQMGAWDYLVKPFRFVDFEQCLTRCVKHRDARNRFISESTFHRGPIIGSSPKLLRAIQWVGIVARTKNNVLLLGETGTGKELFARAVHDNSDRRKKPFTVVDCTNLPNTLAQSILFGHEKGTFTDAKESREGLFKQADGGTIFLDEIADLAAPTQRSLLRVLQEHSFRPLSSKQEVSSDFRLVAATNRDLSRMVQEGTFRKDLYFRLKSCLINLPPLRERPEDVEPLAHHYIKKICEEQGAPCKRLSQDCLEALKQYNWPGNVRELINTMNYAISNSYDAKTLTSYHLPREVRICMVKSTVEKAKETPVHQQHQVTVMPKPETEIEILPTFKEVRNMVVTQMEAEYLIELIKQTDGDLKKACKVADLSRARLYELLQKHEIDYKQPARM
jgi:two-component system NtrC family response regulator